AGHAVGACWPFIWAKLPQLIYGFYPNPERWRVNLTFLLAAALLVPLLVPTLPYKRENAIAFFGVFPVVAFFLLVGGAFGLPYVDSHLWGGLLVTLVVAVTGIVASLPLGILLALGRRSKLPIIRTLSITFIEFWRGVPLITVLIVAIFDLLGQLRGALTDPNWSAPSTLFTGFAFTGLIYFCFCFGMSRYSQFVERRIDTARRR